MEEQILINYTKNENTYLLAIRGEVSKVVSQEDETSQAFVEELKILISKYYGE
jgi:hypothetical protein